MSEYHPYAELQESRLTQLGAYPSSWSEISIGHLLRGIKDGTHGTFKRVDEGWPLLSAKNVWGDGLRYSDSESLISENDHNTIVANGYPQKGDVLLTIVGTIGRVCVYTSDGAIAFQRSVCFLRFNRHCDPFYFYYFAQSKLFLEQLQNSSKASAQAGVYMGDVSSSVITIPPIKADQLAIVKHLDRETARIDALIEKKTRFIELLKEKRQALITQAVTKGIEPNVPMKDSGVEWIGEVPEHWEVKKIGHITPVKRGASPRPIDDPRYFDDEGEFGWVRIQDVTACGGSLKSTKQQLSSLGASKSVKMNPGKLFLSIAATVGVPCISTIKCCIHDGFVYFPNLKLTPQWLFRIFESRECFVGLGKMGTQLNLNTETVGGISIPVPPDSEIDLILDTLQKQTSTVDQLIELSELSVKLLAERRSALITAAVTGQIDLREAA